MSERKWQDVVTEPWRRYHRRNSELYAQLRVLIAMGFESSELCVVHYVRGPKQVQPRPSAVR